MSRRLIALLVVAVAVLTACGRLVSAPPAAAGYRIFLEEGFGGGTEKVTVRDSGSGAIERQLPIGTPAADWSRYYTVTGLTGSSLLSALDPATGRAIAQTTVLKGYRLPSLNPLGPTAGLSPNGQWLALTSQGRDAGASLFSNFLVGPSSLTQPFSQVRVDGDFAFDALSNDGRSLYLIQNMREPNHYQVRLYDVANHSLSAQVVVDKREPDEPMNGVRGNSVADPVGNRVFTVYARENGPFIHVLPLGQPFAFCVDLPKDAPNDLEQQFFWSLVITPDGSTVYGVNGSLGRVVVMTTADAPTIVRSAAVALDSTDRGLLAGLVTDANAKGPRIGGAALSADGRTLFALGDNGIVAIDTGSLKVRARFFGSQSIVSMHLSSDGRWLYGADTGAGKVWQIDPATGALSGEVRGVDNPWAVLWAEAKS